MTNSKYSFKTIDIVLLTIALLFTILVIRVTLYNLVDNETIGRNIMVLTLSIWFTLFIFQYKALRKTMIFCSWTLISIILVAMFFWLHNDQMLNYIDKNGDEHNYAHGLISPFLVLICYQTCRQISLKYYNAELALPGRFTNYIYDEKRKATWLDTTCAIGFMAIPVASFYF